MSDSSKKARRDHARELARQMREAEAKRRRRNRGFIIGGSSIVAAAIIALVVVLIVPMLIPAAPMPGPANMASDGIIMSGNGTAISAIRTPAIPADGKPTPTDQSDYPGTVNVVAYVDYMCPYCGQFESANGDQLIDWVKSGAITLEMHPISLLDSSSLGSKYSTRSANAAACVANYDPDKFLDVNKAFYANQPAETTTGLTDDKLKELIVGAGVTDAKVASCVDDGTFDQWVAAAYQRVRNDDIPNSNVPTFTGTPFVTVDGTRYTGAPSDGSAFQAQVAAAIAAKKTATN